MSAKHGVQSRVPDVRPDAGLSRMSLFGLMAAPLPAVFLGIVVMSRAGVPAPLWLSNVGAALVGVLMVLAASGRRASSASEAVLPPWLFVLGLAMLGGTLMAPGVAGVHRWVGVGPLELHVGAVLLPPLLVYLVRLEGVWAVGVAVLTLMVLLWQPDGAQAVAFAAGWGVSLAITRGRPAAVPVAAALILAGVAWVRPDPLEPVAYVEGIVGLAAGQGVAWGAASVCALALLPIAFVSVPRQRGGTALAVYMVGTVVAAAFGHFPVPILGYGVSPILGYYLAVAAVTHGGMGGARPHPAVPTPSRNKGGQT